MEVGVTTVQRLETIPGNCSALLASLQEKAAHKASLRMYYAAADLYREYRGPFATETQAEREQQALVYEKMGAEAEKNRRGHDLVPPAPKPHVTSHSFSHPGQSLALWQCPACHAKLPQALVVCGHCGLDFRTGQHYADHEDVSPHRKPAPSQWSIGYTRTAPQHRRRHIKKRRQESPAAMVLAVLGVVVFLIGVMAVTHRLMSSVTSAGQPVSSSTRR